MSQITEPRARLTTVSKHGGGCGCKLPSSDLMSMLRPLKKGRSSSSVILGVDDADDAAVVQSPASGEALVLSTDFGTPTHDDPRDFARSQVMHAISDIYACGGRPLYALAVLTVPTDRLDQAAQILEAADQSLREHGCELVGGHTTRGPELSFGLAVIGSVVPARTLRKSGVQVDDVFVLSKRLGVGHYVSAGRVRPLDEADRLELLSVTCQSNAVGKAVADAGLAHACTDVTGEGFLGAIASMARSADVAVEVFIDQVPMMTKAMEYAADGLWSTLSLSNFANVADILETDLDENTLAVLTDPQTSGGLLIACAPSEVDGVLRLARQHGNLDACVVGRAVAKGTRIEARSTKESQQ